MIPGVFGVDETLALQIANIYGTIGATNFGYFDRVKIWDHQEIRYEPRTRQHLYR